MSRSDRNKSKDTCEMISQMCLSHEAYHRLIWEQLNDDDPKEREEADRMVLAAIREYNLTKESGKVPIYTPPEKFFKYYGERMYEEQLKSKIKVVDFQFPMSNPVKITQTKTTIQPAREFVEPSYTEESNNISGLDLGPAPAGIRCDGTERLTKNPAIGAGYSQTNTVYLQEDQIPPGPPLRREDQETPQYSTFRGLCKTGDGNWVSWVELMDGLYEYIGNHVPQEEYDQLVYNRRETLIERLKTLQEEHSKKANAGATTADHELTAQVVYTAEGNIEIRPPPVRRTEEYPGYTCDSYEAVSMENKNTK